MGNKPGTRWKSSIEYEREVAWRAHFNKMSIGNIIDRCVKFVMVLGVDLPSIAPETKVEIANDQPTTQGEKCLCALEPNSGLGRNILEINEHCPVHGKFWA
jgi:hypothetical protein